MSILVVLTACQSTQERDIDWSIPKQALGEFAVDEWLYDLSGSGGNYDVDFFVSKDRWFCTIVSAKNDSIRIAKSFVGLWTEEDFLNVTNVDSTYFLRGSFALLYDSLLQCNLLWKILRPDTFWTGDGLRKLLEEKSKYSAEDMHFTSYKKLDLHPFMNERRK